MKGGLYMNISEARHRANEKYNAKAYDEIKIRVYKGKDGEKGKKELIQEAAKEKGVSVNTFINSLIDKALADMGVGFGFSDGENDTDM